MKKQKNIYYILGKAFFDYDDSKMNDKNNTITTLNINNIEHQAVENNVDVAPEGDSTRSKNYTMTENFTQKNLLEEEITEIDEIKEVAEVEVVTEIDEIKEVVEVEVITEIDEIKEVAEVEVITEINEIKEVAEVEVITEINRIEEIKNIEEIEGVDIMPEINNEEMDIMTEENRCGTCTCTPCLECKEIFDNKKDKFGYKQNAACKCHDICVEDVRAVCFKENNILRFCIPCIAEASGGCRGGFMPDDELPTIESIRVTCADERLSPRTGCDRIINNIEFEVILIYNGNPPTKLMVTPKDRLVCHYSEFNKFPGGGAFDTVEEFREELKLIDGSCKVIIIKRTRIVVDGNDCILEIKYDIIDKLWKHENLLVSAIKPYRENITVCEEFRQGHQIGRCIGSETGSCGGL